MLLGSFYPLLHFLRYAVRFLLVLCGIRYLYEFPVLSVCDMPNIYFYHYIFALFQPSPFFTEQLTAFEVWLDHGSENKKPPEQLPIVLQV